MSGKAWFECCVSLHFSLKGRMSVAIHDRRTPARYTWGVRSAAAPSASTDAALFPFRPDSGGPAWIPTKTQSPLKSYQSAVHEAWKQFIANKPIREKDIPPHILRSWKLSREAGMDPLNPQVPPVLNKRELASLCRQHQTLIDSAKPSSTCWSSDPRHRVHRHPRGGLGHLALAAVGDDNLLVCRRGAIQYPRRAEEHQDHWGVGAVHEHRGARAHPDNRL